MRSSILFGLALAVSLAVAPRGARACGAGGGGGYNGYGGLIATLLAVGAVDVGLALWDGGSAIASHRPSVGYGVFELIVSAPQFALGSYGLITELRSPYSGNRNGVGATAFYTLWMGLLTTHSIWTLATQPGPGKFESEKEALPVPTDRPRIALAPTYVPLGQLSKAGVGLVGRF